MYNLILRKATKNSKSTPKSRYYSILGEVLNCAQHSENQQELDIKITLEQDPLTH